jgi:hypothetical protein
MSLLDDTSRCQRCTGVLETALKPHGSYGAIDSRPDVAAAVPFPDIARDRERRSRALRPDAEHQSSDVAHWSLEHPAQPAAVGIAGQREAEGVTSCRNARSARRSDSVAGISWTVTPREETRTVPGAAKIVARSFFTSRGRRGGARASPRDRSRGSRARCGACQPRSCSRAVGWGGGALR